MEFAFVRNGSNPPFLSTVLKAAADILNLKLFLKVSEVKDTIFKFGRNRLFVLLLAWLTLLPVRAIFPVNSHFLVIIFPKTISDECF